MRCFNICMPKQLFGENKMFTLQCLIVNKLISMLYLLNELASSHLLKLVDKTHLILQK